MTPKEIQLAVHFLKLAADHFTNHICNDVNPIVFSEWTLQERIDFVKAYHQWNGDPEEFRKDFLHLPDFAIMDFLAEKLKTQQQ